MRKIKSTEEECPRTLKNLEYGTFINASWGLEDYELAIIRLKHEKANIRNKN